MAPKDRVQAEPLTYSRQGDTTILRPQASPVDTFVRTPAPLKSELHDVAAALAQVNPRIERFIAHKMDEQAIEDAREAEAKAMVSTAKSWDEAIKKGEAPAGASPLYQRVYEETLGKVHGLNTAQATLWQDWVSPENSIRNTQDPEVIGKWFADKRAKFFEGKNPDWIKGFAPAFAQVQQQLTQKIIGDNVKALEQKNHDALGQLFMERIQAGAASGQSPAQIAAQLADDALPQRFAGMQGKEINTIAAKAIIATAKKLGRTDLLQIGYSDRPDIRNPGSTIKGVFTIPEFAAAADDAGTSILSKANAAEHRAQLAEARAEKKMYKTMLGELVEKRATDPEWEPDTEWKKRWVTTGGSLNTLRSELGASTKPTNNPVVFNTLASQYVDIVRSGGDPSKAIEAMAPYLPYGTLFQLHRESDRGADAVFRGRVYGVQDDALKGMVDKLQKNLDPIGASNLVRQARTDLAQFALEEQRRMSAGGHVDLKKLEDSIVAKAVELTERMRAADENALGNNPNPPGGKPAPKGKEQPQKPQQQGNAIPSDRIVPANDAARGYQFPAAMQEIESGKSIIKTWEPPQGVQVDIQEVNLLRTNPLAVNREGIALWRRFDEKYGVGASRYFATNSETEIMTYFSRQRSKRNEAAEDAKTRARTSNAPNTVP